LSCQVGLDSVKNERLGQVRTSHGHSGWNLSTSEHATSGSSISLPTTAKQYHPLRRLLYA